MTFLDLSVNCPLLVLVLDQEVAVVKHRLDHFSREIAVDELLKTLREPAAVLHAHEEFGVVVLVLEGLNNCFFRLERDAFNFLTPYLSDSALYLPLQEFALLFFDL